MSAEKCMLDPAGIELEISRNEDSTFSQTAEYFIGEGGKIKLYKVIVVLKFLWQSGCHCYMYKHVYVCVR